MWQRMEAGSIGAGTIAAKAAYRPRERPKVPGYASIRANWKVGRLPAYFMMPGLRIAA
jgi:hypothetical protein